MVTFRKILRPFPKTSNSSSNIPQKTDNDLFLETYKPKIWVCYDSLDVKNPLLLLLTYSLEVDLSTADQGDTVRVHYEGTLEDGTVFDSSQDDNPVEFTIGQEEVIPGFEETIIGMNIGDTETTTLSPEEAYGPRHDELIMEVPKNQFPENVPMEENVELEVPLEEGGSIDAIISNVGDDEVTIDANHPLAGKKLTFEIELEEIV